MKSSSTLIIFLILLVSVGAMGFSIMSTTGAPGGYTGSPGDGYNCSHCMGGTVSNVSGWITSDIPADGYSAGQSYEITVTNNLGGSGKYGFLCAPQTPPGALVGILSAVTGVTQLMDNATYVTHYYANNITKIWNFYWKAPALGTGSVTFYAAFDRGYNPGLVALTTYVVNENFSGVNENETAAAVSIGPNPAHDFLSVKNIPDSGENPLIQLLDIQGNIIYQFSESDFSQRMLLIPVSHLAKGLYFINYQTDKSKLSEKILVL